MPIQSLNWNDKMKSLADGDNLSPSQKSSLLTQYNNALNTSVLSQQLGYLPTYGAKTNPVRSLVQVVGSAYDTSGNGGRKQVRLKDGTLVIAVKTSTPSVILYKSTDGGGTWSSLYAYGTLSSPLDVSLATNGTYIYTLISAGAGTSVDVFNTSGSKISSSNADTGQTFMGNCSLTYSQSDNTLHAAWASKNSTYPNSFNIRYAKGVINSDGSVTWGSVTQITPSNTSGFDNRNPTITVKNGLPTIIFDFANGSYYIQSYVYNGTSWNGYTVYSGTTYTQSYPSATVDNSGNIHVVWHGLDSTDTTKYNIRYSKSTDGGVTWSAMLKLTSGNTADQLYPSITCDQYGGLYVYWQGMNGSYYRIRTITWNGSTWGAYSDVTTNTTAHIQYPSVCDNVRTITSPLVIWQDNVSPSIKFSGSWTDTPILSETTSPSAVSNKALLDAIVAKGVGARSQIVTVTSSASSSTFTYLSGGAVSLPSITVTGLSFKPTCIYAFRYTSNTSETITYSELSGDQYPKPVKITNGFNQSTVGAPTYHFKGDVAPASVVNGSFTIPVANQSVTYTCLIIG